MENLVLKNIKAISIVTAIITVIVFTMHFTHFSGDIQALRLSGNRLAANWYCIKLVLVDLMLAVIVGYLLTIHDKYFPV